VATVKELLVKFTGDTKGLEAASNRAKSTISSMAKAIGVAAAAAATAFGVMATRQAQLGDEAGKAAARLGLTTQALTAYHGVARLAGIDSE